MSAVEAGLLRIRFVARERAELVVEEPDRTPLKDDEVRGRTVISLVSSGTEVVGSYSSGPPVWDPGVSKHPGYAAVFEIEEVGGAVADLKPGDLALCCNNHRSQQRVARVNALKVPAGLAPEKAVFARLAKVPMPVFVHTRVRAPEIAVVSGLGAVGLMAAQLARIHGYPVIACDPDPRRRRIAQQHGVEGVVERLPPLEADAGRQPGLGIDCSGHEQAVADICDILRKRGELFLVGVPWVPRTALTAHQILHKVFHRYIVLQSGWEWEMSHHPAAHSHLRHLESALAWLADGRLRVEESAYRVASPRDCQAQYQDLLHARLEALTVVFDWRRV